MRLRPALGALLLAGACAGGSGPVATTAATVPATTTAPAAPTSTAGPVEGCAALEFLPTYLPARVAAEAPPAGQVAVDRFTAIPGTSVAIWVDSEGAPVVALVRGALPPERWLETPTRLEVRGHEGALGRLSEDVWAVAWFEDPVDDCELYTLFLYPPATADEARRVAAGLTELP